MVNAAIEEVATRVQTTTPPGLPGAAWAQFAGSISPEDLALMEQAIEEDCERIDLSEW